MTSTQWVEYHNGTKRKSYNTLPTSDITAEAVSVDGFALSQTDNAGVTSTAGRSYTPYGSITLCRCYLYPGYPQIAYCDITRSNTC